MRWDDAAIYTKLKEGLAILGGGPLPFETTEQLPQHFKPFINIPISNASIMYSMRA